jgi:hypothetical protein
MNTRRVGLRAVAVVVMGIASLLTSKRADARGVAFSCGDWCGDACNINYCMGCYQGACYSTMCTGESGTVYPMELDCTAAS